MALVCLFQSQTSLLDQVPGLGYIPKIFQVMSSTNTLIPKSAIQVVHQLTNSEVKEILLLDMNLFSTLKRQTHQFFILTDKIGLKILH